MYLFFTDTLSVCFEVYIRITLNITHLLTNVVDPKSLDERPFDEFFQVLKTKRNVDVLRAKMLLILMRRVKVANGYLST